MARALMPRQPYSVAVLSTGGRLHPLPFWKGRGLGSGLRPPSSQEGGRGVENCYRALAAYYEACNAERFRFTIRYKHRPLQVIGQSCKNSPKNLVVSKKKLIFAGKKGETIMNTIAIDSNIYKGAESYAKLHNISVTAAIEKAISLFLQKVQPKQKLLETAEFSDALSYVKTLKAKGGKPIPADENSLDALVDKKYAL